MRIADLQDCFASIRQMICAAGANQSVLNELDAITRGLAPFREFALKDFADFLIRAEAFSRGEVPIVVSSRGGSKSGRAKGGTPKEPKVDVQVLVAEARRLYDHASSANTTNQIIDEFVRKLSVLTKPQIVQVASATDFKVPGKMTKAEAIEAVKQRIIDRKGSYQRAGLIDRPVLDVATP
jgi:hypothetical protein